ncbi:hypothetical protein SEVIR_3G294300v4 [Setaria viridis]|uniref:Transcription repressor n=2 Tax=Setaria TaxID=4554 RepID=K3ZEU6_SETIT|nr:transcription repressor OFP1 [Setaria italica]XP_034588143.1 transcription repressor OFP1-like [Setaria viridis]RCV18265.1 hypothetical protein SETIT_3G286300v2 [Setaria italica]TKW27991.1 hypothetical protein SEVIR_3G294300v2 [Setaria viridis]
MSNHHRFKLSHLMPNSWFYKLRDMKRPRPPSQRNIETTRNSKRSSHYYHGTTTPKPLPLSPHRSYHYMNTKQMSLEKLRPSTLHLNPKASDIQFPRGHHHHHHRSPTSTASAIVVEANEFQDLQLRPIRTRPAPTGSISSTCPSSPRLRSRRVHAISGGRVSTTSASGHRRSVARRSFAVVKASTDPPRDFRESMVEMIAENKVQTPEDMEELLECYLSLNSREYHGVIMEVFRGIWLEIAEDIVED